MPNYVPSYFADNGETVHELGTGRPLLHLDHDTFFRYGDAAAILYYDIFGETLNRHTNVPPLTGE